MCVRAQVCECVCVPCLLEGRDEVWLTDHELCLCRRMPPGSLLTPRPRAGPRGRMLIAPLSGWRMEGCLAIPAPLPCVHACVAAVQVPVTSFVAAVVPLAVVLALAVLRSVLFSELQVAQVWAIVGSAPGCSGG